MGLVLVVLSFQLDDPDDIIQVLENINPPHLPYFRGEVRVVVGTDATDTIQFLDGE